MVAAVYLLNDHGLSRLPLSIVGKQTLDELIAEEQDEILPKHMQDMDSANYRRKISFSKQQDVNQL